MSACLAEVGSSSMMMRVRVADSPSLRVFKGRDCSVKVRSWVRRTGVLV